MLLPLSPSYRVSLPQSFSLPGSCCVWIHRCSVRLESRPVQNGGLKPEDRVRALRVLDSDMENGIATWRKPPQMVDEEGVWKEQFGEKRETKRAHQRCACGREDTFAERLNFQPRGFAQHGAIAAPDSASSRTRQCHVLTDRVTRCDQRAGEEAQQEGLLLECVQQQGTRHPSLASSVRG